MHKPLGSGSFGTVYRGKHIKTGKEVAIKVIRGKSKKEVIEFREAAIMNKIKSDNVVNLYEVIIQRAS